MGIQHWSTIPAPVDTVFAWHERPGALQRLMPPWLPGRVREQAVSLVDGRTVIALPGGQRWIGQHDPAGYEAGRAFVDERVTEGLSEAALAPVRWRHTHSFDAVDDGTRMHDRVEAAVGSRALRPMFLYRHRQLADDLARQAELAAPPLTVAVTGAGGLIGTALTAFLTTSGHRVVRLLRRDPGPATRGVEERRWDVTAPDATMLDGVDAVVHLAGSSVFGRFDTGHRHRIRDSRIGPTKRLAELAAAAGVGVFISASGIGGYGSDRGDEVLTETSAAGDGFLAQVVADWEAEAALAGANGGRVVHVRTGIVQSPRGGVLQVLRPVYTAGLGGPLAGGEHWQSWIDLDDLVDIYARALVDERLRGPVNAVVPEPVRQEEYAADLAAVLHRPALLPTPALGPRVLLGDQGTQELVLANQRVTPAVLQSLGHRWRRPRLEDALRHQLGRFREAGR